jgi:protease-4
MRRPRGIEDIQPSVQPPAQRQSGSGTLRLIGIIILLLLVGMVILNLLPSINIGGCVGQIEIVGEIASTSSYSTIGSDGIAKLIGQARDRPDVKALVVIIDSPGGSVVASKEIYYALREVNKPIIAYIGDTGASGGYLVALGADRIYADSASITGSVGARATVIDISRFLNSTGVNATTIKSGEMKDIGDMFRPMTDEEKELMNTAVNEIAAEFRSMVNESRDGKTSRYTPASLEKIADARILTGRQAYELGLVDELGTKKDAINAAARRAGLEDNPQICVIKAEKDLFSSLFSSMGRGIGEVLAQKLSVNDVRVS